MYSIYIIIKTLDSSSLNIHFSCLNIYFPKQNVSWDVTQSSVGIKLDGGFFQ